MTKIVLITGGKRDDCYLMGVKVFDCIIQAEKFCKELNKAENDQKYWRYAEVISEGVIYEVDANDCYNGEFKYYEH